MSDSDDTDTLLLIPPNYFLSRAEELLLSRQQEKCLSHPQRKGVQQLYRVCVPRELFTAQGQRVLEWSCGKAHCMDVETAASMPPPTAAYKYLEPRKKIELNEINSRLHALERNEHNGNFVCSASDISTISNHTVRNQFDSKRPRDSGFVHSTPKCTSLQEKEPHNHLAGYLQDDVLLEIDNFLENRKAVEPPTDYLTGQGTAYTSLPDALNNLVFASAPKPSHTEQDNLISLSEIWGKSGQGATVINAPMSILKEEQLRRQHLEKTVHLLQSRLLEYQQRLSVAIEVDRAKDAALNKALTETKSLNSEAQQMRDALSKLEADQREYNNKMDVMQRELAQAVSLATKFEEKNERLEEELASHSKKSNECNNMYKQQLEELEIKLHGCKKSEEYVTNELNKIKDRLAKAEYQNEKLRGRCEEFEKETATLKTQKETLQEFHQKQKNRADNLEIQKKSLQDAVNNLTENETSMKKKYDTQQKLLKSQYQQQLEKVVGQKLKEFQEQLDKTEEILKAQACERERFIAERAMKQMELINEKSEIELNLMQEKHNEEIDLYRFQLANASKKIDELDFKINGYRSRRADIAEKLHSVMETQWQKALEILTSPNQGGAAQCDADVDSPDTNETQQHHLKKQRTVDNAEYQTPKSNKNKKSRENNLNIIPQPMDRLGAYIELLLSKSPADFDKLDQFLAETREAKSTAGKEKTTKRSTSNKPPWKS